MNKKITVLVVILECILAILLVSVIGKAIETYYNETLAQEIFFTDENGEIYEGKKVVEVERMDLGYQLYWKITPEKTTEKTVSFQSSKPDLVSVDSSGYVNFDEDVDVTITISTQNGKTASIKLVPKIIREGTVDIDKNLKKE